MGDQNEMPKVDFSRDKNLRFSSFYAQAVERRNVQRTLDWKLKQRRGALVGFGLFGLVVAIYTYSICAVKQETFLDDFEEPPREN